MSITVVGSIALDKIETPFGRMEEGLGGAATHFSVSACFFTRVNIVGVVGSDFPRKYLQFFASRGINTEGIQIIDGGRTFRWTGRYDLDLNTAHTLETQLNVFKDFKPVLPPSYKDPEILFLANIDPDLQNHVIAQAGQPGFMALDTMNMWIEVKKDSLTRVMSRVQLVTINENEARQFTGEYNLVRAARAIQKLGPEIVVIKRGEYGALLFFGNRIFHAAALPLEAIFDPTGAGDSFAGGMLGYLDRCGKRDFENLKTAVICGSTMASFNVEKFSCDRLGEIGMDDIRERFLEFERLGEFGGLRL